MRTPARLLLLVLSLLGLLAGPVLVDAAPASAGVGTTGPEICKTEQGGRLGRDGVLLTEHNARCEVPESTTVTITSTIYRNGVAVASGRSKTCRRGTYDRTCKGAPGMVSRTSTDVVCLVTTIKMETSGTSGSLPDKDTACITWSKSAVADRKVRPLDDRAGCEPATLMYPYAGRIEVRHLASCPKDVAKVAMSSVVSRGTSFNRSVEDTGALAAPKDCTNRGSGGFTCATTKGLKRRAGSLYCGYTHAEFEYKIRSQGGSQNDGTKACWYW